MNHRERMEACISGGTLDRPPVALWRHFPVDDMNADTLAEAHLDFQQRYDFDILKVTPTSGYFLYDWGVRDVWQGNMEGTRVYTHRVIEDPSDWAKLPILDPYQGHLATQLAALKKITAAVGPDTPVIQTIFNPLSCAKKLVGDDLLLTHIRDHPTEIKQGLEIITESAKRFIAALVETGIAGLFFAVQHAQRSVMDEATYQEFGRQFDVPLLEVDAGLWLNVLHLHGDDVMFDLLADYPVQVINWHDLETEPDLAGGLARFKGAVCGGLRQWDTVALGTPTQIEAEAHTALELTGGRRFVLGTGCVAPIITAHGNLMAARHAVEA